MRPPKEIDMNELATLMRFKPTMADCAAFFKVSIDTIERRIRKETGLSYAEFRDQNMVHTRFTLIQRAIEKSKTSDTMLIFCLKNLCGWKDKFETDISLIPKPFIYEGYDNVRVVMGHTEPTGVEDADNSGNRIELENAERLPEVDRKD